MSKNKKILIWLPLPPHAEWRGEGIAQTIENILTNFSASIEVDVLVSHRHKEEINNSIADRANINIVSLSFRGLLGIEKKIKEKKREQKEALLVVHAALGSRSKLVLTARRLNLFARNIKYGTLLLLYTWLQRFKLIFRNCNVVWIPTPSIAYSNLLTGKRVVSFWDPFVFEYREFESVAPFLLLKFLQLFKSAALVVTQSSANFNFLNKVMLIPKEKIVIINNGAPNYLEYVDGELKSKRANCGSSIPAHFRREVIDFQLGDALLNPEKKKVLKKFVNESIMFRLSERVTDNSKIIMVSTQARPYKGIDALFSLFDSLLLSNPQSDFLFICTAKIPAHLKIKYSWIADRVFEIVRVPNRIHANLYLISDLVLHPSFAEGGLGAYPQYEAGSIDVPTLINNGRHANELKDKFPQVECLISDFCNKNQTIEKINHLLINAEARMANVSATQSTSINWIDASASYERELSSV